MTHLGNWETFVTMVALAVGIAATRFLPFILFSKSTALPPIIRYLGGALPHAAMAMLLVYCLKEVRPAVAPHGLPEVLGLVATAALHLWRDNVLLSIAGGGRCFIWSWYNGCSESAPVPGKILDSRDWDK